MQKITQLDMITDKPITGHGQGVFQAGFMNYQANFFTRFPDSPMAWHARVHGQQAMFFTR